MHMLWPIVGFCVPVDHCVTCFSPLRQGGKRVVMLLLMVGYIMHY